MITYTKSLVVALCAMFVVAQDAFGLYGVTTNVSISTVNGPGQRVKSQRNQVRVISDQLTFNDAGQVPDTNRDFLADATSSLQDGKIRLWLTGEGGPAGNESNSLLIAQGILFDELRFVGTFSNQTVPFSVSLSGSWTVDGPPLGSSLAQVRLKMFSGGTIADDDNYLINAFNSNASFYNQQTSGDASSSYPLVLTGNAVLNGTDPSVQFYFNSQIIASSVSTDTVFEADFLQTSTLSFTFPQGVTVQSSSGTFPGTVPVPEPISAAPLLLIGMLMRRR